MISRRLFSSFLFCAPSALTARFAAAEQIQLIDENSPDILIGGGQYIDLDTNQTNYVLALTTPFQQPFGLISTEFFPHGVAIDPNNPTRLIVMEKKGPGCCLIDIESESVLESIAPSKGCWFYGHGTFNSDGSSLFIVETRLDSKQGVLSIRDTKTFEILGELNTHGANPHDCRLVDEGKVLAITNSGLEQDTDKDFGQPCVTYLDANTGRLLEKIPLTNNQINAGHLLVTDDMDLAVISAPREGYAPTELGGVSLRPKNGEMLSMTVPDALTSLLAGETLSLAYHQPTGTLAATTPDANLVTFWNMADQTFISAVRMTKPRGICLTADQKNFIVSSGDELPTLYSIATNDFSNVSMAVQGSYISGSHLVNWALEK